MERQLPSCASMVAQLSNPLVHSPVLPFNQLRLNPTGDRGKDLAGLLLRESADLAKVDSLELLGQFRQHLAPMVRVQLDPAAALADEAAGLHAEPRTVEIACDLVKGAGGVQITAGQGIRPLVVPNDINYAVTGGGPPPKESVSLLIGCGKKTVFCLGNRCCEIDVGPCRLQSRYQLQPRGRIQGSRTRARPGGCCSQVRAQHRLQNGGGR